MSPLLILGLLVVFGLLLGLVASRFGLPRVAAYVVAGMVFSPGMLGEPLGIRVGAWSEPLTTAALGIIAYLIGGSMTTTQLRRTGKTIVGSTLGESFGAALLVFTAVLVVSPEVPDFLLPMLALAFAAIAPATAPAGTVAVLHQYRARGPFTNTLLGVVALDDALGVVLFALMLMVVVGESWVSAVGMASLAIGGALLLGIVHGWVLTRVLRRLGAAPLQLPILFGSILLVVGLAVHWDLSPLLAAMSLGFSSRLFFGNGGDRLASPIEYMEETVFVVFFTLAGAHFQFGIFIEHLDLIATYFLARIAGKIGGATIGAWMAGAPSAVRRWLGFGLVPQAGVAVGLALALGHEPAFLEVSAIILNVILATTLLYELLGPFATWFALQHTGEIGVKRLDKTV